MPATTYIVTAAAGNDENHEPFTRDAPARTALRTDAYGFSRMDVHNATHLRWQQVECDFSPDIDDIATGHRVIDDVWLVQHQHGSFSERAAMATRGRSREKSARPGTLRVGEPPGLDAACRPDTGGDR